METALAQNMLAHAGTHARLRTDPKAHPVQGY